MPQTPKVPAAPHGAVELTPPPTPVTPGTSRASFFLNSDHSYVAQTEPNFSGIVAGKLQRKVF